MIMKEKGKESVKRKGKTEKYNRITLKQVKCGRVRMIACVANKKAVFGCHFIYISIYIRTYHTYKLH